MGATLLEPLFHFLYTGKADVAEELITEFLMLAEDLGVEGLANNFDKERIVEPDNKPTLKETMKEISEGKAKKRTNDPRTISLRHHFHVTSATSHSLVQAT